MRYRWNQHLERAPAYVCGKNWDVLLIPIYDGGGEHGTCTLSLIQLAHQGDKMARNTLVEENMGLVYHIVQRFKIAE